MITVRPLDSIHHTEGGRFNANWHFSFDHYQDPENTRFGDLRVFNDDRLIPGAIWPMHPHRDIEGITYVAEGTFKHADSMGNGGILLPGSNQRATLGSGMQHSEQNGSKEHLMRFIQMWILPAKRELSPSIGQRAIDSGEQSEEETSWCQWSSRRLALASVTMLEVHGSPAPRDLAGDDVGRSARWARSAGRRRTRGRPEELMRVARPSEMLTLPPCGGER